MDGGAEGRTGRATLYGSVGTRTMCVSVAHAVPRCAYCAGIPVVLLLALDCHISRASRARAHSSLIDSLSFWRGRLRLASVAPVTVGPVALALWCAGLAAVHPADRAAANRRAAAWRLAILAARLAAWRRMRHGHRTAPVGSMLGLPCIGLVHCLAIIPWRF